MTTRTSLLARSTGELLVLLIAGTICLVVLIGGLSVALIELINPESDTTTALSLISDTVNTLIGLMAGFLAGRTDQTTSGGRSDV